MKKSRRKKLHQRHKNKEYMKAVMKAIVPIDRSFPLYEAYFNKLEEDK